MLISTVKKYNTYTMDKKKLSKLQEETNLCKVKDEEIKEKVGNVIDNKGLVYGIYRKKELVGIYIFERIEDYFVKNEDSKVVVGEKKVDFEAIWYGESTAAFKLTDKILLDEVKEFEEKIESDLRVDLSGRISSGQIAGIEWGEKLFYRKNVEKKGNVWKYAWGYIVGFLLGMMMGYLFFDSLALGICFGVSYASLWGAVSVSMSKSKAEWESFDFVNKKYQVESEEDAAK